MASHQVWERVSSLAKVMLLQKTFTKELIYVASSLPLLAVSVVSESQGKVSKCLLSF